MYADMICDVMPPIPEDNSGNNGYTHENTGSDHGEEAEANIEQLMVSMLEERDKLQEKLRETEENFLNSQQKLFEMEKERDIFHNQLSLNAPQVCIFLSNRHLSDKQLSLGKKTRLFIPN